MQDNFFENCACCGKSFHCGGVRGNGACWCHSYPALFSPDQNKTCFCEECLKTAAELKIKDFVEAWMADKTLPNKARALSNSAGLIEGIDYYLENENYVFTSWYHLRRGTCCKNGCRHCPY